MVLESIGMRTQMAGGQPDVSSWGEKITTKPNKLSLQEVSHSLKREVQIDSLSHTETHILAFKVCLLCLRVLNDART